MTWMLTDWLAHPAGALQATQAPLAAWQALAAGADGPAWLPPTRGTVYGSLLNHAGALAVLGDAVHAPPYKAPPRAPVLYIKPRNTLTGHRAAVAVPADVPEVEIGATLGIVIGRTASRLRADDALDWVGGYTIVNDLTVPHASLYRPALRFRCRDGFCPIGPWVVPRAAVRDPDALAITVSIDGEVVQHASTGGRIRPAARLLADVTEFMTLRPGDVLCIGVASGAPRARAGQRVSVAIDGLGTLENTLVAEAPQ